MAKRKITTQLHVDKSKDAVIGEIKRLSNLELTIQVFENSAPLNVDNQEIYIECYRSDGSLAKQDVDIIGDKDTIICNLKNGVFSFPGIAEIDLTLKDSEGQMTTASLFIKVTGRAVEVDPSTPENYLPDLTEMINKFQSAMNEVIDSNSLKGDKAISDFIALGDEIISTFSLTATNLLSTFNDDSTNKLSVFTIDADNLKKKFVLDTENLKDDFNIDSSHAIDKFTTLTQSILDDFEQLSLRHINDFNSRGDSAITNFNETGRTSIADIQKRGDSAIDEVTTKGTAVEEYFKANIDNFKGEPGEPGYVNIIDSFEGGKDVALSGDRGQELSIRVDDLENKGAMWQEHTGTGVLTINDTLHGNTKNLIIKGKTIGGYNSETAQYDNIVSSGEGEGNKIIVKSTGKNLWNSKMELGLINSSGELQNSLDCIRTIDFIKVKESTKYITSNNRNYQNNWFFYDKNKNFISSYAGNNPTSPVGAVYLKIRSSVAAKENELDTLYQLEEGTIATDYEEYKVDKKEILLPFSGGLNKFKIYEDEILYDDGIINQRCSKHTILQTDSMYKATFPTESTCSLFRITLPKSGVYDSDVLCNRFISKVIFNNDSEHAYITSTGGGLLNVYILKTKLESDTIEGFKKWLLKNPLEVVYALKDPVIHNIEKMELTTFTGKTHIIQENSINGDISCKVKVNIAAQNIRLKAENDSLKEQVGFEQKAQDIKITTTMLANTELFEILLSIMPMNILERGGESNMVEVYVTLILQGDKTLDEVPKVIRTQVEAKLRILGVII